MLRSCGKIVRRFVIGLTLLLGIGASSASAATYQFADLAPNNTPARAFGTYTTPGGFQQVGFYTIPVAGGGTSQEAAIFNGPGGPITDLGPGVANGGYATPTGTQQVGTSNNQAMLWSGSSANPTNLQPAGWFSSSGVTGFYTAATGAQQLVNAVQTSGGNNQALLWSGNNSSVANLTPNAWAISAARAAYVSSTGAHEVGTVMQAGGLEQAAYWSGTANSFIDLNPTGSIWSFALGGGATPDGGEWIVGWAQLSGHEHPIVWLSADPNNYIDLFPLVGEGSVDATNGRYVSGRTLDGTSVFVWDSQTNQVTNLFTFNASGYFLDEALAMDATGDVIGDAATVPPGRTFPTLNHAVEWALTPEPTVASFFALAFMALSGRQRRVKFA